MVSRTMASTCLALFAPLKRVNFEAFIFREHFIVEGASLHAPVESILKVYVENRRFLFVLCKPHEELEERYSDIVTTAVTMGCE